MSGKNITLELLRESQSTTPMPVVIIMGMTGVGKSTFVQKLLDKDRQQEIKIGDECISCTSKSEAWEVRMDGVSIQVVDTPGLGDTFRNEGDIMKDIVRFFIYLQELGFKLKGFIYLIDITRRVTGEEMKHLKMLAELCGEAAFQNIVFATVRWESPLTESQQLGRQKSEIYLHQARFLGNFIDHGAEHHRYNNESQSARRLLRALVGKDDVEFRIEQETSTRLRKVLFLYETSLGRYLRDIITKEKRDAIQEEQEVLQTREAELKKVLDTSMETSQKQGRSYLQELLDAQIRETLKAEGEDINTSQKKWTTEELRKLTKKIFKQALDGGLQLFQFAAAVVGLANSSS